MGAIASSSAELVYPFSAQWLGSIATVHKLMRRFEKHHVSAHLVGQAGLLTSLCVQTAFGWAADFELFETMYKGHNLGADEVKAAWAIWDNGKGSCDVLQIFGSSFIGCRGTFAEKVAAIFQLFDLDVNQVRCAVQYNTRSIALVSQSINREEMTILMKACLNGVCKMHGLALPSLGELEDITRVAFTVADRQGTKDNRIDEDEFMAWAESCPEVVEIVCRQGVRAYLRLAVRCVLLPC